MKFIAIILFNLSFMIILFIPIQVRAQPYVYRGHLNKYYENDDTSRIYYKINYTRLDLSNGQKDSLSTYGPNLLCDNTQNWIISGRQSWRICNFYDKNQCFDLGPQPIIAVYSEQKNKIFIATEMGTFDVLDPITGTEETLLNVDYYYSNSLSGGEGPSGKIFLSADEKTVYIPFYDTVFSPVRDDRIKLAELSTSTYMVTRTRNLQDLGYPGATFYGLCNGRKGKAIIMSDLYFNIYDFDYTMSSPFIYFAKDADPYFTNDGKYLILNELYDSLSSESKFVQLNNSGKFLIYN
ncbi:MAG: hypothetical protein P4L27_13330, partial [Ignavibacteriaceae bacterium]|nr:hypothetical protein [Ignavibacteriaceae bacterium]